MQAEEKNDKMATSAPKVDEALQTVIERINESDNILVTLSKDPTVDEMTAALGLTLMLDRYGKHVTAIYSGKTPNALQFLKPDETFESNTNSLQDFIIALNKEKADHLRYKIEGDFVKVYITPYKTTISESDLEFSRGEVNVDLVIAIDVIEAEDLDAALSAHGRIMHNASLVNISNSVPGRLGGVEWNNPHASSVSEMIVVLLEAMGQDVSKDIATALLTGIVSATERFSNEKTTPDTMALASKMMQLGADQQLIVAQMMSAREEPEEEKTDIASEEQPAVLPAEEKSSEMLDVVHSDELTPEQQLEQMIKGDAPKQESSTGSIIDELKNMSNEEQLQAEEPVANGNAPAVPVINEPVVTEPPLETEAPVVTEPPVEETSPRVELPDFSTSGISEFASPALYVAPENGNLHVAAVPQSKVQADAIYGTDIDRTTMQDKTMVPIGEERPKDYGEMLQEALGPQEVNPAVMAAPAAPVAPEVPAAPIASDIPVSVQAAPVTPVVPTMPEVQVMPGAQAVQEVPAMAQVPVATPVVANPQVATAPADQPMMGGIELPPPPAPDVNGAMPPMPPMPGMPAVQPVPEVPVSQPIPEMPAVQPMPVTETPATAVTPVDVTSSTTEVPQDDSAAQLTVTAPTGVQIQTEPINPVVVQPEQSPESTQAPQDPSAFRIPGM